MQFSHTHPHTHIWPVGSKSAKPTLGRPTRSIIESVQAMYLRSFHHWKSGTKPEYIEGRAGDKGLKKLWFGQDTWHIAPSSKSVPQSPSSPLSRPDFFVCFPDGHPRKVLPDLLCSLPQNVIALIFMQTWLKAWRAGKETAHVLDVITMCPRKLLFAHFFLVFYL